MFFRLFTILPVEVCSTAVTISLHIRVVCRTDYGTNSLMTVPNVQNERFTHTADRDDRNTYSSIVLFVRCLHHYRNEVVFRTTHPICCAQASVYVRLGLHHDTVIVCVCFERETDIAYQHFLLQVP